MARKRPAREGKQSKNVVAQAREGSRSGGGARGWWEFFKSLAGMVAIFLFIRAFFVEAYRIPSESMVPSMLVGDWLFVNKLVYGPHIPFTRWRLPGYTDPKRWDIVVFVSPPQIDQPEDPTPTLVKRLIGMPGDTLYMRNGHLFVNGIEQRNGYGAASVPGDPDESSPLFSWQRSIALTGTRFGSAPVEPTHDNWGPLLIPADHYFMMGDNRYNSKDSRYWGVVPRGNIRGRPMFVYYSYNADDSDRALPFITDIRWRRIGHWIR
jgi:signal peptidase I